MRTFTVEMLDLIERRMQTIAEHVSAAHEASCEFAFVRNYPPTINHVNEAAFTREVLAGIVGPDNVLAQEPTMGAEDFAYMLQAKPGAYIRIGQGLPQGPGPHPLHNSRYDFNDEILPLGAALHAGLIEQALPLAAAINA